MTESTWTSAVKPWREGRSHHCKHLLANQRPNLTMCWGKGILGERKKAFGGVLGDLRGVSE